MCRQDVEKFATQQCDQGEDATRVSVFAEYLESRTHLRAVLPARLSGRKPDDCPVTRACGGKSPAGSHDRDGEIPSLRASRTSASSLAASACSTFFPSAVR